LPRSSFPPVGKSIWVHRCSTSLTGPNGPGVVQG
jgi:hypothetical protein